jgi:uncharacterized membrane protein YhaH (DUF805 family)
MEEYFDGWRNIFNINDIVTRKQFWKFVCINYFFLALFYFFVYEVLHIDYEFYFVQILLLFSIISMGIRRMNDIELPWYYLFIPIFNIYLLFQEGHFELVDEKVEGEHSASNNTLTIKLFFKILAASLVIGVLNLIMSFVFYSSNINAAYLSLIVTTSSIPISFLLLLVLLFLSKKEATNEKIIVCTVSLLAIWFLIFFGLFLSDS